MKILLSVVVMATLLFTGCSQESKKEVQKSESVTTEQEPSKVEVASKAIVAVVDEVVENAKGEVTGVIEDVVTVYEDKKGEVVAMSEKVTVIAKDAKGDLVAATEEVIAVVSESKIDAKALYSSCKGCHGANGEKVALGKSKVIQGWNTQKTADALNGYKDGTYGGTMKGLMKGQVSKLSADDIKAISEYISTL